MDSLFDTLGWCILGILMFIAGCIVAGFVMGICIAVKFAWGVMCVLRRGADFGCVTGSGLQIDPSISPSNGLDMALAPADHVPAVSASKPITSI